MHGCGSCPVAHLDTVALRIIDEFLKEVGEIEAMLVPTPEGMVCEDPRRVAELRRRSADIQKKKTKVFLMADLWVRGMVPGRSDRARDPYRPSPADP